MGHAPLVMIRQDLLQLPAFELPEDYRFRYYRAGDDRLWAEIETAAGEFENLDKGLERFMRDFSGHEDELERRCFFIEDDAGSAVGTGTAWFDGNFQGEDHGRVHWISVRPDHQGRGLGKALVSRVMQRLAESHTKVYLRTLTRCKVAICIYLDFGFVPLFETPDSRQDWASVQDAIRHPILEQFLRLNSPET